MRGSRFFKFADLLAGSTILWLYSFLRRRGELPRCPKRIGLMRAAAIGDALLLKGIVDDLQLAFPDCEIIFIHGETNRAVEPLFKGIRVLGIKLSRPWESVVKLRRLELDVLLDFSPWPRIDALITAFSAAKFTAGFETPNQCRHYCYDAVVRHLSTVHELENYRRLAETLGVCSKTLPMFELTKAEGDGGLAFAIFHPWAGGYRSYLREWTDISWVELGCYLKTRTLSVKVTAAPSERNRAESLVKKLRCEGVTAEIVTPSNDLSDVAEQLSEAKLIISVNTGIMHLASCIGVPTIALNGPTSTLRWGPVGPRSISIEPRCEGCGYLDLGSEYEGQREDCMSHILVSDVIVGAEQLLGEEMVEVRS